MRLKIIAGNLAVVVLLGLAAYVMIADQLRSGLAARLDSKIGNDKTLFGRSYRLSANEFRDLIELRASMRQLMDVFSGLDESSRRTRAYEAAEATHAWLSDPARGGRGAPELVVITDETGKALARNGARNVMFGKALLPRIPALGRAFKTGRAAHDVWVEDQENKVLQTALAPIRNQAGTIVGALIVGYELSNGVAAREAGVLGREVAFVMEDRVYSSSLRGNAPRALHGILFGPEKRDTNAVLAGQAASSRIWKAQVGGADYVGVTARLPMSPSLPIGFVVLGNRTEAMALADAANVVLVMMALGAIMIIGYGFVIGNSVMRPIEAIEEGVLAVINGRTDLRLETDSAELGGLAFRINQLLNVFTGTAEDTGDESSVPVGSAGAWQDGAFSEGSGGGAAPAGGGGATPAAGGGDEVIDDAALATELGSEDPSAYRSRVYQEYVAAKQALGENVSNIPEERFSKRLEGRGDALAQKHGCRMVRFQVHTRDNQVVLRPVLIR